MGDLLPKWAVAYSAGADSTCLLVETKRRFPEHTMAFHVHHGLQAAADEFVRHCESFCANLGVPLYIAYVNAKNAPGESPEAAARGARYNALIELAHAHGVTATHGTVLLAQHADDQIETLLIALSRGAGLAGLSSMPAQFEKNGVRFQRPYLGRTSANIRSWLQAEGIDYFDDPTNLDKAFLRNKLRLDVMPVLMTAFAQNHQPFLRSIEHIAQANDLLSELAQIDLALTGTPPHIANLQNLTQPRQANVLRFWLKSFHQAIPSAAQMDELIKQIEACQTKGQAIHIKVASGFVTRQGETLGYNPRL